MIDTRPLVGKTAAKKRHWLPKRKKQIVDRTTREISGLRGELSIGRKKQIVDRTIREISGLRGELSIGRKKSESTNTFADRTQLRFQDNLSALTREIAWTDTQMPRTDPGLTKSLTGGKSPTFRRCINADRG
jgi:hypothetical protein